jgi:hypothetical protein
MLTKDSQMGPPSLTHVLLLQQLSVMQQQSGNEEAFEYNSLLRHGIFEAYSGILNGMSTTKCDQYLQPSAPVCYSPPDLPVFSCVL